MATQAEAHPKEKPAVKMDRKNIHSRAYKKRQVECEKEGMEHEQCLKEARKAAQIAVQKAMDDGILEDPTEID